MTRNIYINSLKSNKLGLSTPLPVEITGVTGNFVATWLEGSIEGEGNTKANAIQSLRANIVQRYAEMTDYEKKGGSMNEDDSRVWAALLNFTVEVRNGQIKQHAPGEAYNATPQDDPNYKGPIFG